MNSLAFRLSLLFILSSQNHIHDDRQLKPFFLLYVLVFKIFLCCWRLMYVFIFLVKVTEWPPIGKIAAHSAYEMFSCYKYLIVSLFFSHLGFWNVGVRIFF